MDKICMDVVTENEKSVSKSRFSNKNKLILIGIAVALLICIAVIIVSSQSTSKRLAKQLDLGQKYLEEMDYEQAIVAFNKAIEIDPMSVEAYLGMVEVYIRTTDFETALEYAKKGYEATGDERLKEKIDMIESGNIFAENGWIMKTSYYDGESELSYYVTYTYNLKGNMASVSAYTPNDVLIDKVEYKYDEEDRCIWGVSSHTSTFYEGKSPLSRGEYKYDAASNLIEETRYDDKGNEISRSEFNYVSNGHKIEICYYSNGSYYRDESDAEGNRISYELYDSNNKLTTYTESKYDDKGHCIIEYWYDSEGNLTNYFEYEYNNQGKVSKSISYDSNGKVLRTTVYE